MTARQQIRSSQYRKDNLHGTGVLGENLARVTFFLFTINPSWTALGLKRRVRCRHLYCMFYYYLAQQPPVEQGLLIHEVSRSHTRRTTVSRTPLDEWDITV